MIHTRLVKVLCPPLIIAAAALWNPALGPGLLRAQTETGRFRGTVADESGGVVTGSTVTCTGLDTGISRTTVTNERGNFDLSYLPAGRYELSFYRQGFKKAVVPEIVLQVNHTSRVDVKLELGVRSEEVSVSADASSLQSDTTVVGGQVDRETLVALPGRDFFSLIGLGTSAAQLSLAGYGSNSLTPLQPGRGGIGLNLNLGGYRQTGNYYMLDGVSDTDWNINAIVTVPSPEALQELRVQTSTNSAAFGQVAGGTINVVTRSGSNNFHGQAYDYLRNAVLDARPYNFNPGVLPKLGFKSNQFGASLGGPFYLPRLYNGHNRTFFFAHYEGTLERIEAQSIATVPSLAARNGQLGEYGRRIFDPLTLNNGRRSQFPGNAIPLSRMDLAALKVLDLTPAPNEGGIVNNLVVARAAPADRHQGNLRLDHSLRSSDFIAGSYHASSEVSSQDSSLGPVTGTLTNLLSQNVSLSDTHVFKASIVTNIKFGFNRLNAVDRVYGKQDYVGLLGIHGLNQDPVNWGLPSFQTGSIQVATDGPNRPTVQRDNLFQLINDWTLTMGRHRLEIGGEFRRTQFNFQLNNPARGQFRYTGSFTAGADPLHADRNTGLEYADFLLGMPLQASRVLGVPQGYLRSNYLAGYIGDTIRAHPRLTLILGVRYDYFSPPTELRNNYFNLDFSMLPAPPRLVRIGVDQSELPERGVRSNPTDFSPRIGWAYQPNAQTVLRSAYGIYRAPEIGAVYYDLVRNGVSTEINNSGVSVPQLTTENAFTNPQVSTPSYYYVNPGNTTPYVQQWNFSVQRVLPFNSVVEAVYAGTKGTHLFRFRSLNTAFQTETGMNLPPRPGNLQQLRTFPSLGPITGIEGSSSSTYHSLQLRLDKRFSNGITAIQSFTWAKSIDDAGLPVQDFYQNAGAQDERNLRAEKGLSAFDVRKRFVSAVIWRIPFGTGMRFVSHGIPGYLVGPWQISSLFTYQDGYPQNILNFAGLSTFGTLQHVNLVPGKKLVLSAEDRMKLTPSATMPRPDLQYYDPTAISVPGPYELGNAGRDIGPTPATARLDLSALRTFAITESQRLLIRADFINALNIVNYGIPATGPTSVNFGQLTTVGPMRTITISLKYEF